MADEVTHPPFEVGQELDLRAALDRVGDGVFALDRDWRFTYVNAAAARMVHTRPDHLVGRNLWEVYPQAVSSVYEVRFREALDTQRVIEFEEYYDLVETVRAWFSVRVHPSPDGLTVVFRDITRLRALVQERRELLDRLIEAEERERARIAAEVHDDPVQVMAVVRLRLQVVRASLDRCAPEVSHAVEGLDEVVSESIERLRTLLSRLEPTDLAAPLADSVRGAARQIFFGTPVTWTVDAAGEAELPVSERTQVLRIVKEALHNVRAHAGASQVSVQLREEGSGLSVEITDDGVAEDPATFPSGPVHRGLATMRDRALLVGGSFVLEPAVPHGCTARLFVPRPTNGT